MAHPDAQSTKLISLEESRDDLCSHPVKNKKKLCTNVLKHFNFYILGSGANVTYYGLFPVVYGTQ
jgi:hypothetical protein